MSGAPLLGRLLALPTNIRLGWKGLSGTNTLTYWVHSQVMRKSGVMNTVTRAYLFYALGLHLGWVLARNANMTNGLY
jgi:hypothetical protein